MLGQSHCSHRLGLEQLEKREMLSSSSAAAMYLPTARGSAPAVGDDYGNTFAQATAISLSATGTANQTGRVNQPGDVDIFKFIAPVTGKMTIQELAAAGGRLDSFLYVYDAKQQLVAANDDYGKSLNSRVEINLTAGETYYIKAAGYGWSVGAYTVQLATAATAIPADDVGNTIAQAVSVTLSSSGVGTRLGTIEQAGDVDMFKIVASATGTMTIQQSKATGGSLMPSLAVYDADGNLLIENNSSGASQSSQVQISVLAGTTYYVKTAGYQASTGAYILSFSTSPTTTTIPTDSGFQITTTITGMTTAEQAVIQQAIDYWEAIIVGDLPDVTYRGRVIDDIEIAISGIQIDSTGNILGQATATAYRQDSNLPYLGYIQLDTADVAAMLSDGSLLGVIEHEIAHVLGFGVIWSDLGLMNGTRTNNPGFTGALAVAEYNAIFGTSVTAVPVEADGGSGTRLAHWDEAVFSNELMTGWYNSGATNPLSRITVASMADIGYQVNMAAADVYSRPTTASVANLTTNTARTSRNYGGTGVGHLTAPTAAYQLAVQVAWRDPVTTESIAGAEVPKEEPTPTYSTVSSDSLTATVSLPRNHRAGQFTDSDDVTPVNDSSLIEMRTFGEQGTSDRYRAIAFCFAALAVDMLGVESPFSTY